MERYLVRVAGGFAARVYATPRMAAVPAIRVAHRKPVTPRMGCAPVRADTPRLAIARLVEGGERSRGIPTPRQGVSPAARGSGEYHSSGSAPDPRDGCEIVAEFRFSKGPQGCRHWSKALIWCRFLFYLYSCPRPFRPSGSKADEPIRLPGIRQLRARRSSSLPGQRDVLSSR